GNGFFVGIIVLTLWMRGISALGWSLSWLSIGLPLGMLAAILLSIGLRSSVSKSVALRGGWTWLTGASLTRWQQIAWLSLLALLVSRFMLLGSEILWRPLYPWDAWTQWATKARVWYEFRHIVPFVQWPEWIATTGTFIDAAPHYPATMPLLQVWSCIAFGGWDDSAMNWPWLMILIALVCVIYGALRGAGVARVGALVGAYLVASLPLLDVHVALAGYADLAMGAFYTVAAHAFYRWSMT